MSHSAYQEPAGTSLSVVTSPLFQRKKRLFTADEYERLADVGILRPDDRTELIEGEIIRVVAMKSPHAACISRIMAMLQPLTNRRFQLRIQCPLRLDVHNEPEPDVLLLKPRKDFYESRHPAAADVLLLIEVCDTSIEFDQKVKVPLYARFGVPEVWLIGLRHKRVEVYREPSKTGYVQLEHLESAASLTAERIRGLKLRVAAVLGK
jgi:Uma2 family endonuclease